MAMDREERERRAGSFGSVAEVYERARPGYPEDAVRWLAGSKPRDVVDLAAGTGKLTRSLVALGHRVTAVEPLPEMLAQLHSAVPAATAVTGTAESMPLADGAADVVTVAQAFHWFDHAAALREIARVLRPGGRLGLVWNTRDDTEEWVTKFTDTIVGGSDFRAGGVAAMTGHIDGSGLYGAVERASFSHVQLLRRDELVALVSSRSECAVLPDEEQRPVLARVGALFDTYATDGVLAMPYVTECFRTTRL
jgi:ubiquinone/menaquinone biosynthesis C-methylase UbiE